MTGPIRHLDAASYQRHLVHGQGRVWAETNCYVDVLIELLHGLGFEPIAAMPFTLRIDFEGDQWTFFKFPHADLLELFGLDVQELNPWRGRLAEHVDEQVGLGRPVLVELDSYFLPDTHGTAYKLAHVKSTVAVNEIDIAARHMGYFHGQGYYHLDGQDFADIYQLEGLVHERMLPPYIEYVKILDRPKLEGRALVDASVSTLRRHVALLPETNPFRTFRARFERDLQWLMAEPIDAFHTYSFATFRQYGACFELVETYLAWLARGGEQGLDEAVAAFRDISSTTKTLQFQLARAMARKRELPLEPLDQAAALWNRGMSVVRERYG
ncbi:MAG: DUF1839 family protein [Longimicrobiales bacterium]